MRFRAPSSDVKRLDAFIEKLPRGDTSIRIRSSPSFASLALYPFHSVCLKHRYSNNIMMEYSIRPRRQKEGRKAVRRYSSPKQRGCFKDTVSVSFEETSVIMLPLMSHKLGIFNGASLFIREPTTFPACAVSLNRTDRPDPIRA